MLSVLFQVSPGIGDVCIRLNFHFRSLVDFLTRSLAYSSVSSFAFSSVCCVLWKYRTPDGAKRMMWKLEVLPVMNFFSWKLHCSCGSDEHISQSEANSILSLVPSRACFAFFHLLWTRLRRILYFSKKSFCSVLRGEKLLQHCWSGKCFSFLWQILMLWRSRVSLIAKVLKCEEKVWKLIKIYVAPCERQKKLWIHFHSLPNRYYIYCFLLFLSLSIRSTRD